MFHLVLKPLETFNKAYLKHLTPCLYEIRGHFSLGELAYSDPFVKKKILILSREQLNENQRTKHRPFRSGPDKCQITEDCARVLAVNVESDSAVVSS